MQQVRLSQAMDMVSFQQNAFEMKKDRGKFSSKIIDNWFFPTEDKFNAQSLEISWTFF